MVALGSQNYVILSIVMTQQRIDAGKTHSELLLGSIHKGWSSQKKKSADGTVIRQSHLGLHCYLASMGSHRLGDISRASALRGQHLPPWLASTFLQQEHLL